MTQRWWIFATMAIALGATAGCGVGKRGSFAGTDFGPEGDAITRGVVPPSVRSDEPPLDMPLLEGPFEELWIIADDGARSTRRVSSRDLARPAEPWPLAGVSARSDSERTGVVRLPLESTEWEGRIDGPIVSATVRQRFVNTLDRTIDARYSFPLPHDCAIHDLTLRVGDRTIRAVIRDRATAARLYDTARRAGHPTVTFFEMRPNVFFTRVGNIAPGAAFEIEVALHGVVGQVDGWNELVLPLVVGPRTTPGGFSPPPERAMVSRSRTAPAEGADRHELRHLEPGERSAHRVTMRWTLDAGAPLGDVTSPTHRLVTDRHDERRATITLADAPIEADRDVVLRWRTAPTDPSSITATVVSGGDRFALTIIPPTTIESTTTPIELVIVVDRSRPIEGPRFRQAKAVAQRLLDRLDPHDAFSLIEMPGGVAIEPGPASRERVTRARNRITFARATGESDLTPALLDALRLPPVRDRVRHIVVISTFQIGNEAVVMREALHHVDSARLSTVAVGHAANQFLAAALPLVGDGVAAILLPESSGRQVADALLDAVRSPALTHWTIDAESIALDEMLPSTLPDLRLGRSVTILGRTTHHGPATLELRGRMNGVETVIPVIVDFDGRADGATLARLWARTQIADFTRRSWAGELPEAHARIRELALRHGLVSPFTAMTVVDASTQTVGPHGGTVTQALPIPPDHDHAATVPPPPTVR